MKVIETPLSGLLIVETRLFADDRGRFQETWNANRYSSLGLDWEFVQDNISVSRRGVLRGLHYQDPFPQGKLVGVLSGSVYDVAVDIRPASPTFGRWFACELSGLNGLQMFIPPGFAHGFVATSEEATFLYKCTDYYRPECEGSIRWDDPDLAIEWPIPNPVLSVKDAHAPSLRELELAAR